MTFVFEGNKWVLSITKFRELRTLIDNNYPFPEIEIDYGFPILHEAGDINQDGRYWP